MLSSINSSNEHLLILYASLEPVMGCRILSLYNCYKEHPDIAQFFYNQTQGLACILGGNLFVCGEHDSEELVEFCRMFSCSAVSGKSGSWCEKFLEYPCVISPVMVFRGDVLPIKNDYVVDSMPDRRCVYNILCEDQLFKDSTSPLHWISDIAARQRMGVARLYAIENKSTSGVYFRSQGIGIIAGVMTIKEHRKKGLASTLIAHITSDLVNNGYLPVVIGEDKKVEKFYKDLGFYTIYSHSYILLQ